MKPITVKGVKISPDSYLSQDGLWMAHVTMQVSDGSAEPVKAAEPRGSFTSELDANSASLEWAIYQVIRDTWC